MQFLMEYPSLLMPIPTHRDISRRQILGQLGIKQTHGKSAYKQTLLKI